MSENKQETQYLISETLLANTVGLLQNGRFDVAVRLVNSLLNELTKLPQATATPPTLPLSEGQSKSEEKRETIQKAAKKV